MTRVHGSDGVAFSWWNQQPAGSVVIERMSTISLGMACRHLYPMTIRLAQRLQTTPYSLPHSSRIISDEKRRVSGLSQQQRN